jgi:hypothetical protein
MSLGFHNWKELLEMPQMGIKIVRALFRNSTSGSRVSVLVYHSGSVISNLYMLLCELKVLNRRSKAQ